MLYIRTKGFYESGRSPEAKAIIESSCVGCLLGFVSDAARPAKKFYLWTLYFYQIPIFRLRVQMDPEGVRKWCFSGRTVARLPIASLRTAMCLLALWKASGLAVHVSTSDKSALIWVVKASRNKFCWIKLCVWLFFLSSKVAILSLYVFSAPEDMFGRYPSFTLFMYPRAGRWSGRTFFYERWFSCF